MNAGSKKRKRPEQREKVPLTTSLNDVDTAHVEYWSGPGLQSPKNKKRYHLNEAPQVFSASGTTRTDSSIMINKK